MNMISLHMAATQADENLHPVANTAYEHGFRLYFSTADLLNSERQRVCPKHCDFHCWHIVCHIGYLKSLK